VTEHFLTDLFERYHRALYRYFLRHGRRPEDAEDLVQDVFYRASRSAGRYQRRGTGPETVWIFRIAHNLLLDTQRHESGTPVVDIPAGPVSCDATQLLAFGLHEALGRINAIDREVFLLREMAGLSYAELATVVELTEDGVRARLFRVRGQLREVLGERVRNALKDDGKDGAR
jgi:RNA polymerase sigma-70 factor, ECF subfamily